VQLRVRRDENAVCELAASEPVPAPAAGEALLRIDRFGLTANNVTYARLGEEFDYWRLFPATAGWGLVPAWGYATVMASRADGVTEGDQIFGLVPMGQRFQVTPVAGRVGFADAAAHRIALSPVYNQYLPAGDADDLALVLRPLFGTSVLLDLLLSDAQDPGPVTLTSASSKTAYGLAHLLHKRGVATFGLTSPQRVQWVRELGLYDAVHSYNDLDALAPATVLVDFAGDRGLVDRVHAHLGRSLRRSILVGFTHQATTRHAPPPPGPRPEFFFAPTEMTRRGHALGPAYAAAWTEFAPIATQTIQLTPVQNGERLPAIWRDLVAGRADPATAFVVSL